MDEREGRREGEEQRREKRREDRRGENVERGQRKETKWGKGKKKE